MAVERRADGTLMPGSALSTGGVGSGYKKAVLDALKAKWTPEKILELLDDIDKTATSTRSPKAKLALAELILSYVLGKPKQSLEVGTADSSQLLAALLSDRRPLLPPREGIIEPPLLLEGDQDADIDTDN